MGSEALTLPPVRALTPLASVRSFYALTKPRVIQLVAFCAAIGMFLASPGMPPARIAIAALAGIWMVASAAAAFNCVLEQHIDARMTRTARRPTVTGTLARGSVIAFAAVLGSGGGTLLLVAVNTLTAWLTLATFLGYAVVYTLVLKPRTPQNIVIGGIAGAMPPLLGWVAVRGTVDPEALLLVLIIFLWTPPHFWALALYRLEDYRRSGLPMLPLTHGVRLTRLHVLLYTLALSAASALPFAIAMSGAFYLAAAIVLDAVFVAYAWRLWRAYSDRLAYRTFRFSIVYLALLFGALLVDHYTTALAAHA
jgi:protoheme IX farnesyltransferase